MILTLNGPTVVQSNSNSPHDHPYNVVLTLAICGVAQPRVLQLVWVGRGDGCAQEVIEGDRCAAHHCVHIIVGGALVVVPRVGCSGRIGGADDHHDRGLLPLDEGVIGVSEVQLPLPLLREALDERNRGCGVLDSHVALTSPIALRWERGI
eukprot:scaffold11344_cov56-Phaeocystis_antarctica.AAC.1